MGLLNEWRSRCTTGTLMGFSPDPPIADPACFEGPTASDLASAMCTVYSRCNVYSAGVRVAAGDVDGDGCDEVLTAPGPIAGGVPRVKVWDASVGECVTSTSGRRVEAQFMAYSPDWSGGVYVAAGDFDTATPGDEIITGAGAGGGPHTRMFKVDMDSASPTALGVYSRPEWGWYAYSTGFAGGVRVGGGEVDCTDSADEMLTVPGSGITPTVKTWNYPASFLAQFDAYTAQLGAFVADGDVYGSHCSGEIVTGVDAGGGPHVRTWRGPTGSEVYGFMAFGSFSGGVRVGSGELYGSPPNTLPAELITAQGPGGNQVKVFDVFGGTITTFTAYTPAIGLFVAGGQVDNSGKWEIITGADDGGGPHVRIFTCCTSPAAEMQGWYAY